MRLDFANISPRATGDYIPGLDGLRAAAVLIVMAAHFEISSAIPGGFGVTVFFFISGFLITRLLLAEYESNGRIAFGRFYARRALRLSPPLLFMLAGTIALMWPLGIRPQPWETAASLFYFMNYRMALGEWIGGIQTNEPWDHLWSLAVEEHFYLLWPLLIGLCAPRWRIALVASIALLLAVPLWRTVTATVLEWPLGYNYFATDTRLDSIVWGCAFALSLHLDVIRLRLRYLVGYVPAALGCIALLWTFLFRDELFRETIRYTIQGATLFVLALSLYGSRLGTMLIPVLEFSPIRTTGRLSYALYLWHLPMVLFTQALGLTGITFQAAGFALSFALAGITMIVIERPVAGLRRALRAPARPIPVTDIVPATARSVVKQ